MTALGQPGVSKRKEKLHHLRVGRAGIAAPETRIAGRVFQAKTGLVSLGHLPSGDHIQQVVVAEGVHAVVVPCGTERGQRGVEEPLRGPIRPSGW